MSTDRLTYLRELLQTVETVINDLITKKIKNYRIGERLFTYYDIDELLRYRQELIREINSLNPDSLKAYKAKPEGFISYD